MRSPARILVLAACGLTAALMLASAAAADALPGPSPPASGHGWLIGIVVAVVLVAGVLVLRRMARKRADRVAACPPPPSGEPGQPENAAGDVHEGRGP